MRRPLSSAQRPRGAALEAQRTREAGKPRTPRVGIFFAAKAAKRRNAAIILHSLAALRGPSLFLGLRGFPASLVLCVSNAAPRGLCADESGRLMGSNGNITQQ